MSAYFYSNLSDHQKIDTNTVIGILSQQYSKVHLDQKRQQTQSWEALVNGIKRFYQKSITSSPKISEWLILYEYKIPRRGKRIDVVLLANSIIFVIEFKNNQLSITSADKAQLEDYCLDLRDFHFESKDCLIVPILLCSDIASVPNLIIRENDSVQQILYANFNDFSEVISTAYRYYKQDKDCINLKNWNLSPYSPTPTIIEAAQSLYAGQSVTEISRSHAGAENLTKTTNAVLEAIKLAQQTSSKIICFITGVPGAGKTLAGLNIVHNRDFRTENKELGVFLSGNSPLVKVLSEALSRDFSKRENIKKPEAKRRVKTFIHNIHEFIDEYYFDKSRLPVDKVLIYDEAQRAWTKEQKTKKSNGEINESEPEVLLSIMNRFSDWSVIIALIGGGQEINTGEAGLREWGKSIESKFRHWKVYISPELLHGDHSTGNITLFSDVPKEISIVENRDLHLRVSIRSYKANELSYWVSLILENKIEQARIVLEQKLRFFPIVITRNLEDAKKWLKEKERGTRRIGIVASSGGRRLKAYGFDPKFGLRGDSTQEELGAWYLNPADDVRSSNFLEIVATEYAVQGLEIDWVGVFWDGDLHRNNSNWDFKQFKGTKWLKVKEMQSRQFILNKYRVLLTRAREGMVIWVPKGDDSDKTRNSKVYDDIYKYLELSGLKEIKEM
jgi:hypothetical protein